MRKLIHLGTVIESIFGVLDNAGNVIEEKSVKGQLREFSEMGFVGAQRGIAAEREKIVAETAEVDCGTADQTKGNEEQ
jgi:hypothetical protein